MQQIFLSFSLRISRRRLWLASLQTKDWGLNVQDSAIEIHDSSLGGEAMPGSHQCLHGALLLCAEFLLFLLLIASVALPLVKWRSSGVERYRGYRRYRGRVVRNS